MDVAALVISLLALLAAAWSAWATHRQARATEVQAMEAGDANRTAQAALDLAREAETREQKRLHVEERPQFDVEGRPDGEKPLIVTVSIKNPGPLAYESVLLRPDMDDPETRRLVRGLGHAKSLAQEVAIGSCQSGETVTTSLIRTDPELTGKVKLLVTAERSGREWLTVHYIPLSRPARAFFV